MSKVVLMKRIEDDSPDSSAWYEAEFKKITRADVRVAPQARPIEKVEKATPAGDVDFVAILKKYGGPSWVLKTAHEIIDGGEAWLNAADFYHEIEKRAAEIRTPDETPEQAFSRTIADDPAGQILFKAMRLAPGEDAKEASPSIGEPKAPEHLGPAHAKLHALTVDRQRAVHGATYAAAQAHVYSHRDNEALRSAVRAEHLAHAMAQTG